MKAKIATDIDFIVAKTRAKHSRLYEGDRLTSLLRFRDLSELARELFPMEAFASHVALERRLIEDYADTLAQLWRYFPPPRDRLFIVLGLRLQVENVKVVLRSYLGGVRLEAESLPVVPLPEPFRWPAVGAGRPGNVQDILDGIPEPDLRSAAGEAFVMFMDKQVPLYLEAGLDRGYFRLLAEAWRELDSTDRGATQRLVDLELDTHNLMFILRARVNYGLDTATVARLAGPSLEHNGVPPWVREAAMGDSAREILARAPMGLRRALVDVPAELPLIERRLWQLYYQLANRMYFRSFFDVGCPYAFTAIRRMELANLITVVESVRYNLPIEDTLKRFIRPE